MRCFVTGASGFLGANLADELTRLGHEVKALLRPGSDRRGLRGVEVEVVELDLGDRGGLAKAMRGCDWCFHLAASYHLWLRDYRSMYETNVGGTGAVLGAAWEAGCARIVYSSTVGCMGLPSAGNGTVTPTDEQTAVSVREMGNHYKRSKWQAEQAALRLAGRGAPVIIVNPTAPVGPRDVRPTPTGRLIVDFLNGNMPAYMDTGLNWVHVRDVAVGCVRAAEKGRVGERYILGNAEGNWTMRETLLVLQELTGLPAPKIRIPYRAALLLAWSNELLARVTGHPPRAPLAGVRMARHKMYFNPAKAIRELGMPQTPPRQGLADAVAWFGEHAYWAVDGRRRGKVPSGS